jgi:HPt (histidine-containing phosphotransfer) domain-containing protein
MGNEKIIVHTDDEDVLELIPDYLANRRDELGALDNAIEQNDFETLRALAHKMKGSGGGYGLNRITEIGRGLEAAAKVQDVQSVKREVAALREFLERVEVVGK